VGYRNLGRETRKRGAKCARRVALNDQQVRRGPQQRLHGPRNGGDMGVRVFLTQAAELHAWVVIQAEVGWIEPGMLPGEYQGRHDATRHKGAGNRLEFDGFGPGPDDQPDVSGTQPSP
jgi:hypothetical protein